MPPLLQGKELSQSKETVLHASPLTIAKKNVISVDFVKKILIKDKAP